MKENIKKRLINPYFWLGLGGVIFSVAGIDFNTLTSWKLLGQSFVDILANPVMVVSVIAAVTGVFVDTSTKGLKDKIS